MFIEHVHLHNIGPFADLEQDFQCGLIGLFGPNGVGKSTMVNTVYGCLTNDWSRFPGVKTDLILDTADPAEPAYAEIRAVHDDRRFTLYRGFRPNRQELYVEGEKTPDGKRRSITKDGEIRQRLEEDLGVDRKIISTYVFVNQWEMFNFLSHTPSERAEAYKHLCRTGQSQVIFDAANKMLADNELSGEITDNSDELVTSIGATELQIKQLYEQRDLHQKKTLNEKSLKSARQILRKRERHGELMAEIPDVERKVVKRKRIRNQRDRKLKGQRKYIRELELQVAGLQPAADMATLALKEWALYEARRKRRRELREQILKLAEEGKGKKEPEKPLLYEQADNLRKRLAGLEYDREEAQEIVDNFEEGQSRCPTCRQIVSQEFLQEQQKLLDTLPEQIVPLKTALKAIQAYDKDKPAYDKWKSGWEAKVEAAKKELAARGEVKEPEGNKTQLEADVKAYHDAKEALEQAGKVRAELDLALTQMVTRVTETENHLKAMNSKLETCVVDDKLHAKAQRRTAEHEAAFLAIAGINGQLVEKEEQLTKDQEALDKLRALLKRRRKIQKAMRVLTKARDAFHWEKLPWTVAQNNLALMEEGINQSLQVFGGPYWAEADENLSFNVHFPGHPPRRAEWLSGGQRGVFAITFRRGVNLTFGADIGTMWLDEPTAGLDEDNVSLFANFLERLAAEVRGKRQLVVITHADSLRSSFDQVIELRR